MIRSATCGSSASISFLAERANSTEYSATRFSLCFCRDQPFYVRQRFARFITPLMRNISVKNVFPQDFMFLEINQYCLFMTTAISQKFNSWHVHDYLQVGTQEIIPRSRFLPANVKVRGAPLLARPSRTQCWTKPLRGGNVADEMTSKCNLIPFCEGLIHHTP